MNSSFSYLFLTRMATLAASLLLLTSTAASVQPAAAQAAAKNDSRSASHPSSAEPWVVFIYSRECPICRKIDPIIKDMETRYKSKAHFLRLDITDDAAVQASRKVAKDMKFDSFLALYEDAFPSVGIFNDKKKCLKELFGNNDKEKYVSAIGDAIQKSHLSQQ